MPMEKLMRNWCELWSQRVNKSIYRVYDLYCTGDSYLHTESEEVAKSFCASYNKENGSTARVECIELEVPEWKEDQHHMPK